MERTKQSCLDAVDEAAVEDQIFLTEAEQIATVCAFGCRGQAEQEPRAEVVDQGAVGAGGGVVELVDDDVVEGVGCEGVEVACLPEGLHGSEQNFGVAVLFGVGVTADARLSRNALYDAVLHACEVWLKLT